MLIFQNFPFHSLISVLTLSILSSGILCLDNGLALTPPMGWMSWEKFKCDTNCKQSPSTCISETLFMDMADRLHLDGYKKVGYEYVNLDDCWMANNRTKEGLLQADPHRFPHGISYLADYIHSLGLKLGIYTNFGQRTCMGYPGTTRDQMELDAKTFASWGVDMLKMDACFTDTVLLADGFVHMKNQLNATGRPIVFSCSWPYYRIQKSQIPNWNRVAKTCNLWRVHHDIVPRWKTIHDVATFVGDHQSVLSPLSGPGRWNDPDMIVAGDLKELDLDQTKAHLALWAILSAPLLMSNDLRKVPKKVRDVLTNRELIEINQDPLGRQGQRIYTLNGIELWLKHLSQPTSGSAAILFLNNSQRSANVSFSLSQLGFHLESGYYMRNILDGMHCLPVNIGTDISFNLHSTQAMLIRISPNENSNVASPTKENKLALEY